MQLDGDDVLLPSAAELLINVFEKNKDDVGFVYGDTHLMHEDGNHMQMHIHGQFTAVQNC